MLMMVGCGEGVEIVIAVGILPVMLLSTQQCTVEMHVRPEQENNSQLAKDFLYTEAEDG